MNKLRILLMFCTLILLLCAARPLICWTIGWDLQFHRVPCRSLEFDTRPQPVEPMLTATQTPYIEPTATLDWPLPYATPKPSPTATLEPYPSLPTETLQPYPWGGFGP